MAGQQKFTSYSLGSKFTFITDNNPLCHLSTTKLRDIEQRWAAELAMFDFDVKFRPGRCNTAANALAQQPLTDEPEPMNENAEYDGTGTVLDLELVAADTELYKIKQVSAT